MAQTVESMCNALAKSQLLQANDIKALYVRWRSEAQAQASNVDKFMRWLVVREYVTDYQATLLGRGQTDNFFLNQYKILDRIGQGRMAGIFKAAHRTGTIVAIKVLPPSKAKNIELFSRFQREARMARKLKHPNVVRTFQVGETRGLNYLVMEYLEGETLEDTLKRLTKLPPAEAVRLVFQALTGLNHIHDQGMVHRDLKPANLMLVPFPKNDTAQSVIKILDIGLGKLMFDEEASTGLEEVQLTTDGAMLGSPEYMAPEQARNAHGADIRSDIYTLGCVLYHCLAGQSPFYDVNVVRIMVKHATEQPKPLKEFNPAIPDGLQMIVNYMLAKDPNQRYPSPDRAAQALQVFLASGAEALRPLEAEPQMQAYLHWLDDQPGNEPEPVGAAQGAPVATLAPPTTSRPVTAAIQQKAAAPPRNMPPPPPPRPAAATQPAGLSASAADVELVPTAAGPRSAAEPVRGDTARSNVLLLGIIVGIVLVLMAGGLGLLLNYLIKR